MSDENIFKILIATDNHLGYGEKLPERGDDSFRTFEEILKLAVQHSVDFILLGGDLFHESRPSPYTIYKCLDLLRKYCLGDKAVEFELLSDQSLHFSHLPNPVVNYEDPNLNVSIPVFTIHGNHDDPVGQQQISALDIVASTGLVNYFGRWNDLTKVEIMPMLIQKGETRLALYGLSHIKDERLGRLFRDKKVTFLKPEGEWFHLLILHQNRAEGRGRKNFIPMSVLPDFIDLVIWGHEHDCLIEPTKFENDIHVSQPGSSIATSLAIGESKEKKVGILQIRRHEGKNEFKIDPITLQTVRPFVHDELFLTGGEENEDDENYSKNIVERTMDHVKEKIEEMIEKANQLQKDREKKLLPLIRLNLSYTDERQAFNTIRFGQSYKGRIANPEDALILKHTHLKLKGNKPVIDEEEYERMGKPEDWATRVEDVIRKYFESEDKKKKLVVCSVKGLTEAVTRYVDRNDIEALELVINHQFKKTLDKLDEISPDLDCVPDCLENLRLARQTNEAEEVGAVVQMLDDKERLKRIFSNKEDSITISDDEDNDDSETVDISAKPARGKDSRGGRARQPRGARSRGSGRAAKN